MGATVTINGPVVPSGVHNMVIEDAHFHSPTQRLASSTSYHAITVGVRSGAYTDWIGTWDQALQSVEAGTPKSILNTSRRGMRLKAGHALVVKIVTFGVPATLEGARINFSMARVGGRSGTAKPLVAAAALAEKPARSAVSTLERQINEALSKWQESVALQDPVTLAPTAAFHGRLQRDSATQISLQRYSGNWVEVDGEALSITSSGLLCLTTDGLLSAAGGVSSTAPSVSTLYYVYVGSPANGTTQLRLCATAPSRYLGAFYLGSDESTRRWRFCGWVYVNGSTEFVDTETQRLVVNYHNRLKTRLFTCPAYSDNGASTTYTEISATWTKVNAGTGSDLQFIGNGEDVACCEAQGQYEHSAPGTVSGFGISYDSATSPTVVWEYPAPAIGFVSSLAHPPVQATAALHTFSLLARTAAITMTIIADEARNGAAADPYVTFLIAWIEA